MVANVVFHDLVATPAPHDLLDHHGPHAPGEVIGSNYAGDGRKTEKWVK